MSNGTEVRRVEPSEELDRLAHAVIGAAIEVHRHLGPGYIEAVYEEALCVELHLRDIPFERQAPISVNYKGHGVGAGRIDLLVGGMLVVELKAVEALTSVHTAQIILKAFGLPLGLLINFNVRLLKDGIQRIIFLDLSWRLGG